RRAVLGSAGVEHRRGLARRVRVCGRDDSCRAGRIDPADAGASRGVTYLTTSVVGAPGGVDVPDAHDRIAASTFKRPLVETLPERPATTSTWLKMAVLSAGVVNAQRESTSAAAPDTCGVAIDVPLKN